MDGAGGEVLLSQFQLPKGSVQYHRKQATTGALEALIAACKHRDDFPRVLLGPGTFESRFRRLRALRASSWDRTTCFDVLARAGLLGLCGQNYRPTLAHLASSTGPYKGFDRIWGIEVTRANADSCEDLLHWWTAHWKAVCSRAAVHWPLAAARFRLRRELPLHLP